jgi:hypothetical protein
MRRGLLEQLQDVLIVDSVIDKPAGAPWTHEAHPSKEP